jgi:hypothetical protein
VVCGVGKVEFEVLELLEVLDKEFGYFHNLA